MREFEYTHKAQYYETDQMGVVHHSNYIRWMEEARVDLLNKEGYGYKHFEETGYISPVLSVQCEYKDTVNFDDTVKIIAYVKEYNGLKFSIGYNMYKADSDKPCTIGSSTHCFLDSNGRPVMIKKTLPDFDQWLRDCL